MLMAKGWAILFCALLAGFVACKTTPAPRRNPNIWSELELRSLEGKTRDEIRDVLGPPDGFYTIDSKGRWHYANILVSSEGAGEPRHVWLFIYFSRQGEQLATIVDIRDRGEVPH